MANRKETGVGTATMKLSQPGTIDFALAVGCQSFFRRRDIVIDTK
jgi:hypothetical protein